MTSLITQYIGYGLAADRPATPSVPTGALAIYTSYDSGVVEYYDHDTSAWLPWPGGSASLADGDYGDVTVGGSGTVFTIDNGVVTYAKMQDVSATDTLLGRATTGSGDVEEIACTSVARTLIAQASQANMRSTGLGLGTVSILDETTTAQYRANTADKALSTDQVWAAADYVALTPGTNVATDMSLGFNFSLAMGGNYTLDNPTNTKNGQTGAIVITQDGTGSRTLAYGTAWKFAGGTDPTLSTPLNTVDVLFYQVISSTVIVANLVKAIA